MTQRFQNIHASQSPDALRGDPASSNAGAPHCPHAQVCGACQHVNEPYEVQLAHKDAYIAELFGAFKGAELRSILGMENPFYYRNKVISPYAPGKKLPGFASGRGEENARTCGKYSPRACDRRDARTSRLSHNARTSQARRAKGQVRREILCGMYAAHSHHIVPTDECLVENEQAKQVILAIRSLMPRFGIEPYREDAHKGFLRHAVVRVGHTSGEMLVTLVTNGREFPGSRAFCRELVRRCPSITTIVQNINERQTNVILGEREQVLYGPGFILDKLCGLSFRISSQSFYQVNAVQTEVLYEQTMRLAGLTGKECAIDAYCGTGTIGLVAAKRGAAQVIGVDTTASAVRDARENARHNGVDNARFVVGDAGAFMREIAAEGTWVDVVFMDPPRAGASEEFLKSLAVCAPARIVYISCNPKTQVRDVQQLKRYGYQLRTLQPVDMFPHTDHVECVALMSRKDV